MSSAGRAGAALSLRANPCSPDPVEAARHVRAYQGDEVGRRLAGSPQPARSTRVTMPLSYCATHTAPSPTAMYAGEIPTLTGVPATEFVDGSSSTNVAGRLWSGSYRVGEVEPVAVSAQTSFSPAAVWTTRA